MSLKYYLPAILIMCVLLFSACNRGANSKQSSKTLADFAMYSYFNDEPIPFTPHYSPDGHYADYKLDWLEILYNGKVHEIKPIQADLYVYEQSEFLNKIYFADYNFDGFLDIVFRSYFGPIGRSEIFLYNPKTHKFSRNEELSGMTNSEIDYETQIIKSFDDGGDQGMIFDICEYKWINGKLTLIYSDRQNYDVDLDKYVRITRTLQGNGTWTEQREENVLKIDSQQIEHNVMFNNRKIPMIIFYTNHEDIYYITEKIIFYYDGVDHTLNIPDDWYPFYTIGQDSSYNISVDDFNFDNYMDIAIFAGAGVSNYMNNFFIYNPKTKSYEYNENISRLPNVLIEKETKTVTSHAKGGHAGMIYTYVEYKWIDGIFTQTHREIQEYDPGLDIYIRNTRTLQSGGAWSEQRETFKEEDLFEQYKITE